MRVKVICLVLTALVAAIAFAALCEAPLPGFAGHDEVDRQDGDKTFERAAATRWLDAAAKSDRVAIEVGGDRKVIHNYGRLPPLLESSLRERIVATLDLGSDASDKARRYAMLACLDAGRYLTTKPDSVLPVYGALAKANLDVVLMAPQQSESGLVQCVFIIDSLEFPEIPMLAAQAKRDQH